jgi:hypothetical protein
MGPFEASRVTNESLRLCRHGHSPSAAAVSTATAVKGIWAGGCHCSSKIRKVYEWHMTRIWDGT